MRAFTAMEDALVILDEDGSIERLRENDPECLAVSPDVPERVFCGTFGDGLYRSTDGGLEFSPVGEDVLGEQVTSVAIDPTDPDVVYAGTEPSRVYYSADGGDTWVERDGLTDLPSASGWSFPPRPHTHHVRWLDVDPTDPDRVYVAIEAGALVRTDDRGRTWRDHPAGGRRDNHTLATHPDDPGRVYTAAGDGYAESTDGGDTWTYPQEGLDHRYVWGLAVDPDDPDRVMVSAARGAGSAHRAPGEAYLYRREGPPGESEWERLDDRGIPTGDGTLRAVLHAPAAGVVYAANDHGLYRSADFGDRFEPVETGVDWPERFDGQTCRDLVVIE